MFAWYNEVLRNKDTPKEHVRAALAHIAEWKRMESKGDKFPFTTTIHVINSAIIKLSRAQKAEKVFRGTKGGRLPDKFWTGSKLGSSFSGPPVLLQNLSRKRRAWWQKPTALGCSTKFKKA